MASNSQFQRGSGCYTCAVCRRRTRSTGRGDNEHVGLCEECYEVAGLENEIADHGDPDGKIQKQIDVWNDRCRAKGGQI